MASVTLAIPDKTKEEMKSLPWVNWSELTREKTLKKEIFNRFIKTGTLSDDDQNFCDSIDWYPVDELELKEEYVKKLEAIDKKPAGKPMTVKEFNKWCDSL